MYFLNEIWIESPLDEQQIGEAVYVNVLSMQKLLLRCDVNIIP